MAGCTVLVRLHPPGSVILRCAASRAIGLVIASVLVTGCTPARVVYHDPLPSSVPYRSGILLADRHDLTGQDAYPIHAAIVPHHLVAAESIALGVRSIALSHPKRIILLSPDHFARCRAIFCVTDGVFATSFGDVATDPIAAQLIASTSIGAIDRSLFQVEHGITAVLPFIRHYLPEATVVPVVLSQDRFWQMDPAIARQLLRELLDDRTALIVSSDFSHYLPLTDADREDQKTMTTLLSGNLQGIRELKNPSQSDCPGCLWMLADAAETMGFFNPSILLHTNSARLLNDESASRTTSHFAIVFFKQSALTGDDISIGGDVTFSRSGTAALIMPAVLRRVWSGSGERILNLEGLVADRCDVQANPYLFCNPVDALQRNAGLATYWVIINNHMLDLGVEGIDATRNNLATLGQEAIDSRGINLPSAHIFAVTAFVNSVPGAASFDPRRDSDAVLASLRSAEDDRLKIVIVHDGREFDPLITDGERRFLQSFVDAGADAVIRIHSHVVGDMEIYRGKPIFHGLGNFLFDQHERQETATAAVVRLTKEWGRVRFEEVRVPCE